MTERLRVGIVGLGIGAAHADGYHRLPDLYEVVVVADPDEQRRSFVTDWLGCEGVTDLDEVCARDDVDLVSLATPPFLHLQHLTAVLGAGKHAVCEKPLVGSLADIDALDELQRSSGRSISPVYQYRWGRGLQRVKHLVDAGVAGRCHLSTIDVSWRRRPDYYEVPWRGRLATELGGVVLSHALHALDMLTYTVGPVRRAFARTATRVNDIETEDCAVASLEMADGSLATLGATLGSAEEISRHRFCFERFSAESNTAAYENHREPWVITPDDDEAAQAIEQASAGFVPGPELYKGHFARLHAALTAGAPPPVTMAEARASLELVTALYWSARTGDEQLLPLPADHPAYGGWR